jgi:hypothetical protein
MSKRNEPVESDWLSLDDREHGKLALAALGSLRKTFEHWMTLAVFFRRMRELSKEHGGKRESFQVLLLLNGFDNKHMEGIGGKSIVSKLERIAEHEDEVRKWHRGLDADKRLKWAAPTTLEKHCPALLRPKSPSDPDKPPKKSASELKRENEQLLAHIDEMEASSDGGNTIVASTTAQEAYTLLTGLWQTMPHKLKQLGKLINEGDPDAPPKTGKRKRQDADDFVAKKRAKAAKEAGSEPASDTPMMDGQI